MKSMTTKYLLIFITFLLISIPAMVVKAQDCTDYHEFNCTFADWTYFYSRQSKSALFQRGQTSQLKIIAYGGEDYFVSVCTHRKFAPIRFKIFEDNENKTLLYDNISEEYINTVSFSNNRTRKLIIEVTVPEAKGDENVEDKKCVGVLLQFKKSESAGDDSQEGTGF